MRDIKDLRLPKDGKEFLGYSKNYGWFVCSIPVNMSHYRRVEAMPKFTNRGVVLHGWLPLNLSIKE